MGSGTMGSRAPGGVGETSSTAVGTTAAPNHGTRHNHPQVAPQNSK